MLTNSFTRFLKNQLILIAFIFTIISCRNKDLIVINTELGDIEIELYSEKAPVTCSNFVKHIKNGSFKNSSFYRTVTMDNQPHNKIKIEVIQGGLGDAGDSITPIPHETTQSTGVLHLDGVISMARMEPGTASTEFFICVGDQPELDFGGKRNPDGQGFSAFGKVIKGMDIVKKIHQSNQSNQRLLPRIKIDNIDTVND